MFSYIQGRITEKSEGQITLENNGIGYEMSVSSKAMNYLADFDGEVKIYTYFQMREDGVSLYGFYSKEEKDMFLKLITVSGVGPKGAIGILSSIDVTDLCVVIASQDVATLSGVKGIGKKTAERVIVDLKGKVSADTTLLSGVHNNVPQGELDDAIEVLVSLGLSKMDATRSAENVYSAGDSAEDIITKALSYSR